MEGLQSDTQKLEAIYISLIQSDHPFNRFTSGNKETLLEKQEDAEDITQELRKFYEQYYSANLMYLCVSLFFRRSIDMYNNDIKNIHNEAGSTHK